ncbi:MAG: class II aldolase/adducin family protein [candidate division Zixibacteria bacterium]|nr:class II aldolase/adducin family protein [candidate division Zixibacteria bacterium]
MSLAGNDTRAIIEIGRRLAERGLVAGTDGNLSVRVADDGVLITASGRPKGYLRPDDLVEVSLNGQSPIGASPPSSECDMHLSVYRARPDIGACVHAHPPHATAFAITGQALPSGVLPEVVVFVGDIPLTEYAPPGTPAVGASLAPYLKGHNAFLLRNHGVLTVGRTLEEAYHRMETVEHYARIILLARGLGVPEQIPPDDMARLTTLRSMYEQEDQ